ncbi:MAG: type II secretion system F family protein [Burkholderiaceae bacterium]|nr:type II secretion system F family protein [Burkholderiaceae bacterium]
MDGQSLLFLVVVFLAASGVTGLALWLLMPSRVQQRVAQTQAAAPGRATGGRWTAGLAAAVKPLAKLSLPAEGWEGSAMKLRFINAGWRGTSAPVIFFGIKTMLAFCLPLLVLLSGGEPLLASGSAKILLVTAGIGYYLPNLVLRHVIAVRQREIFESFPDALDLLIICVEAGLSLDQALAKVAAEIDIKSKVLAQELQLVQIELRSGFTKEAALRHLALRTGVEDIDLLVAMLIQADRFGTSMGDSLRVHADNLRTKRRQRAEEAAAKIAVKLLLPLIFMIFPTLMLVLMGPAVIQIYRVLLPTMSGN